MNEQVISAYTSKPLMLTYVQLRKVLVPFCKGKKPLLDMINDIWNSSIPQPNADLKTGQQLKMVFPQHFVGFARLCLKENG